MRKSLFLIFLFVTNLALAQEDSAQDAIFYEPFQSTKTWVFKSKTNRKEKMIRTGDKVKVYVRRMNPGDKYLIRGILVDINGPQLVLRDKNSDQHLIDKLAVKRIIASRKDGLMKTLWGMLLVGAGCLVGGIGLLFALFSIDNQNPGNTNVGSLSILLGVAGLLLLAVGMKIMDDNASDIIIKPFSGEWEISEIAPPTDTFPLKGLP